jgi:RNA polymerase sigma-70 factor (ECF subfamily)
MTKKEHSRRAGAAEGAKQLSAVTVAFLRYNTFLKRFLESFVLARHDVEDMAQEAYLRAYVAEQRVTIDQPKAFLFRVARNLALNKLSEKSSQITDYIEEAGATVVIETGAAIDEEIEAQQSFGLYCEAVASLPEKCRQVFLLRKVHGLTHKDIAERMALSSSSVEKYLRQGILACEVHIRNHESPSMSREAKVRPGRMNVRL